MRHGSLFVDHVFMLVDAAEAEHTVDVLGMRGLLPSSRRSHGSLGTSNVFFCFDNAFFEILWIGNRADAGKTALGRHLMERTDVRERGANRFGIGFRTATREDELPFQTWVYQPPGDAGLRNNVAIAVSSQDLTQPLLFRAQRMLRPDQWTDGKAGERQQGGGYAEILELKVRLGEGAVPSMDLRALAQLGVIELDVPAQTADMEFKIGRADGSGSRALSASRLDWVES